MLWQRSIGISNDGFPVTVGKNIGRPSDIYIPVAVYPYGTSYVGAANRNLADELGEHAGLFRIAITKSRIVEELLQLLCHQRGEVLRPARAAQAGIQRVATPDPGEHALRGAMQECAGLSAFTS